MRCQATVRQETSFSFAECSEKATCKVIDIKKKKSLYLCSIHGFDIMEYKKRPRTIRKVIAEKD